MLEIRIENYVVKETSGRPDGWEYSFKEGEYFIGTCVSRDRRVSCTYKIDHAGETILINTMISGKLTCTKNQSKVISQNNGTGSIRLIGGSVYNRYGYFRRKIYQDFLDKYNISSTRTFEEYGYETTFILESTPEKQMRLVFPKEGSSIEFLKSKAIKVINDAKYIAAKPYEMIVVRVNKGECFFLDETYSDSGRTIRRMYAPKNKNILTLLA